MPAPPPAPFTDAEESARLAALHRLAVLDTLPEPVFDAITRAAAAVCGTPIAVLSLIDEHRQWFKSSIGLGGAAEMPRALAFCDHTIRSDDLLEVPDTVLDTRFASNPFVTGDPNVRFYAGSPVVLPGGERIGTVCVADSTPRMLKAEQRAMLDGLSRIASACLQERRQYVAATAELAVSEARYRSIVEDQTETVTLADPDGTLRFVNGSCARALGLPVEQLVGRSLFDFLPQADRPAVKARLAAACIARTAVNGISRIERQPHGELAWMHWTSRAIVGADGQVTCIHSVGRDITALKQAEEALSASERRFRELYEATPALMHSVDAAGRLLTVSGMWLRVLGYAAHEVLGRSFSELVVAESQADLQRALPSATVGGGDCDRLPIRVRCSDGRVMDMLLSATIERDADDRPVRALAVLEDVTERRRLAAALERTHADLAAIVDNVPAMLGYWDRQGVNRFANREYQAAMGMPMEAIQGHSLQEAVEAIDPGGYTALQPHVQQVIGGTRQEFELATLTVNGLRQFHMTLVPDRSGDGQVGGFYGMAYDITGRKTLELRLRESEQHYRALFDNLSSAFAVHEMVFDADGRSVDFTFVTVNPAYAAILGYDALTLRGRRVTDVFPGLENDAADWIGLYGNVVKTGEPVHVERFSEHFGRWFDVVAYRAGPSNFATIVVDVTERRQVERERALSEQRLQLLVDAVHDHSMYLLDADGIVETWNAGAERIKGYAASEIVGQHLRTFFAPADAARGDPERQIVQARDKGRFAGEGWRRRKNGQLFWASVVMTAIHDDQGGVVGFTKVTRDLTERQRRQALLEGVAALSKSAMLLVGAHGRIEFINAEAEAMFGQSADDLLGQTIDRLLVADPRGAPRQGSVDPAVSEAPQGALQGRRRDGSLFDVELAWSRFDTQDGPAAMAAIIDVTEQRRQHARLQDALSEKETLLKEVYHRVKNNLQVVQSLLSLQQRNLPAGSASTALEESVQRVRAMALVHEKLYQSGNLSAVSLPDYVADLLRQLAEANGAGQRGVALRSTIADIQTGLDNAIPFGLLVTELVTNAIKHGCAESRCTVTVTLTPADTGALLTVADDGAGLPAGFELAGSASMGLQLAASLAQQLGGALACRSDGGTVFQATLTRL